ncbi:contact-dependent growth inhibition system immunity protein [Gilvibacter sediminis]|uniref:contact-dependent growth inhibition system immunity protein n=1 Tax=Gilvibacter sediminis TaxID=379071 RepID=UPI002350204E|nr:contact-dependent growth inhibition system immunity protein [Gilvibacter sediminis]MDC7997708.1 contact-dependent growth inhibition system immunity protein [Gilvibacter sediminis]
MKLENNWRSKSLENLEKDHWGPVPKDESRLVTRCHQLRKIPLDQFETEDLRLMIGQSIGLKFLVPIALEVLEQNILAEGDLYEGDLLSATLTSDRNYWESQKESWDKLCAIIKENQEVLNNEAAQYSTGKKILAAFDEFEQIH